MAGNARARGGGLEGRVVRLIPPVGKLKGWSFAERNGRLGLFCTVVASVVLTFTRGDAQSAAVALLVGHVCTLKDSLAKRAATCGQFAEAR